MEYNKQIMMDDEQVNQVSDNLNDLKLNEYDTSSDQKLVNGKQDRELDIPSLESPIIIAVPQKRAKLT